MQPISRLLGSAVSVQGAPYSVTISLAASATTDGMDITIAIKDYDGNLIPTPTMFRWWISEDAQGEGLTADTYSGDVTTVTGTEFQEVVTKKHFLALTTVAGAYSALAVDSANPTDQYVAVEHPVTKKVIVSAASGTNWEGA
jgi:hypothetical protein